MALTKARLLKHDFPVHGNTMRFYGVNFYARNFESWRFYVTCCSAPRITNSRPIMGDRFLSSAGAGGNCARPMRLPDPSPVLDKNRAPMGPGILSSTGAGVWRRLLWHFRTPVLYWMNFSLRNYNIGPYPQYGWDFPEEIPEKFRKEPGKALRAFPGISLESTAGMPQTL